MVGRDRPLDGESAQRIGVAIEAKFISCKSIDDRREDTPESIAACLNVSGARQVWW